MNSNFETLEVDIDRNFALATQIFEAFSRKIEEFGISDIELLQDRLLQATIRSATSINLDRFEYGVDHISDARFAATWSIELMRASPLITRYNPSDKAPITTLKSRINAEFALYFSLVCLEANDTEYFSETTRSLILDALQFRDGCRHTLGIVYSMIQDRERENG